MKKMLISGFLGVLLSFGLLKAQPQHSLIFDGVDDYVTLGNDASLNITGPITLEAWLFPASPVTSYRRFITKEWQTSYNLGAGASSNSVLFGMAPNGNLANTVETSGGVLQAVRWVHVAGTWDGTTLRIYINGEEEAQKPWVNNSVTGSNFPTILGTDQSFNPNRFFDGRLEEVRLWNVARTAQELRDNMYKELVNPELEPNLVAYYSFNEGSGQTSADLSSNNNTAILGGTLAVEPSDPTWGGSTAPFPYYTVSDGTYGLDSRWAMGQGVPPKPWSVAKINHAVNVNANHAAGTVIINTAGKLTINSPNTLTVNNTLQILSSSSGTGSLLVHGVLDYGDALIERYYSGGEWHFISSPVSNAISGLFTGLYLQYHHELTNNYYDIIPTNIPLVPGKGYAIWNPNDAKANFSGNLNLGTIGTSGNLDRSGSGNNFGWNLVGNPYPSPIDWDAISGWTKANINNAVYIHVNASTWATYIGGIGTNGGTRYIAPGQGFFVSVTDAGGPYPTNGSLIMNKEIAVHNNTTFFKSDPTGFVRIGISGNGYSDETVIRFVESSTTSFDAEWDAYKLFGYIPEAPQIYSISDQSYSINTIPEPKPVAIGVKAEQEGVFTISTTEWDGISGLYLEDTKLQLMTNLLEDSYTFNHISDYQDDRFILHFAPVAGIDSYQEIHFKTYTSGQSLNIDLGYNVPCEVLLFNLSGQQMDRLVTTNGYGTFNLVKPGIYIVKVITQQWTESVKVVKY